MSGVEITRETMIADVLGACATTVTTDGTCRWTLKQGRSCRINVGLDNSWLTFRAPQPRGVRAKNAWQLATANAVLVGRSRLALGETNTQPYLVADIAIDTSEDLEGECRRVVSDLMTAREQLRGAADRPLPDLEGPDLLDTLRECCLETDWPTSGRERGPLIVKLGAPGGGYQAAFYAASRKDIRISVTLAQLDSLADTSRIAIAALILSANSVMRLVRCAASEIDNGARCFLEVRFSELPSAAALDYALGALSAASTLLNKTLPCLADAEVSRNFLVVRGIDPAQPPFSFRGDITQPPKRARRRKRCLTQTRTSRSK